MKQAQVLNPSRTDIINWVNSHLQASIGPLNKIEDLGNGVAYLMLLDRLRPGCVKTDKIIKQPKNYNEIMLNLKQLSNAFDKLNLQFRI